jgi:tellurite resistance protein
MTGPGQFDEDVSSRLSMFDDDPDLNDWIEVALGAAMVTMGLHQLFNPGGLFAPVVMQWLGAGVFALGLILLGHGLKDMLLKEVRASIVRLEMDTNGDTIDYGLIRDVLLHPDQYQQLLYQAYELAYADGVLTDQEMEELSALARVLQIPERSAARMATRAAIESALADGHVSEAELDLIIGAARPLGLSDEELGRIVSALDDHNLNEEERAMLDDLLGQIPGEDDTSEEE